MFIKILEIELHLKRFLCKHIENIEYKNVKTLKKIQELFHVFASKI